MNNKDKLAIDLRNKADPAINALVDIVTNCNARSSESMTDGEA